MLSRKGFEALAAELKPAFEECNNRKDFYGFHRALMAVTDALEKENPRFSAEKFIRAVYGD